MSTASPISDDRLNAGTDDGIQFEGLLTAFIISVFFGSAVLFFITRYIIHPYRAIVNNVATSERLKEYSSDEIRLFLLSRDRYCGFSPNTNRNSFSRLFLNPGTFEDFVYTFCNHHSLAAIYLSNRRQSSISI